MRKSYHRRPDKAIIPIFWANEKIRASEVRLIDEKQQMIGVVSITEARRLAEEAGLDLVEVSPKAQPPVCKIMDLGSFKYQKEKEAKAQKQKQKVAEIKGIRLSFKIGDHDREVRLHQAQKFIAEDNKVKIEIILKGRERQYTDLAQTIIKDFVRDLGKVKVEQPFAKQQGKLSMVVAPDK
ncbi:MAG: translation initiation factor IF-3 [Patescibacteria group bacterium]|jgi:translation initiation factor IF-3